MGVITEVSVSRKTGLASIEPPIDASYVSNGRHDIGDCIYVLSLAAAYEKEDVSLLTEHARKLASAQNTDEQISVSKARRSAENLFREYGRNLVWAATDELPARDSRISRARTAVTRFYFG